MQFAQTAGPIAALLFVAAVVFAESGLLVGFFLPGDSILFTLGVLIQGTNSFTLDLNIHLAVLLLFLAAVLGDNVGYMFGRKIGPHLFTKPESLLFKKENVLRAQRFYDKHGKKTIIIARFIPIVRTFAPLIAGVAKMKHKTFMLFNMIGGALWTAGVTYVGFFLGKMLKDIGVDVDLVLLPIVALVLIVSITPTLYQVLKDKQQRQAIWSMIKLELKKLFTRKK